jgi:hypothetical protein
VRPVVAIDIDGTMGKYHEHFWDFARGWLGVPVPDDAETYRGDTTFKKWFLTEYETYNVSVDTWHDIKLAYRQGGMKRTMPVYPFAAELCEQVVAAGAELWLTTTRPYIRHDNVDPDTREWLLRNGIIYHYLIYDGRKYNKLKDLVGEDRVVAVLDDLPEEITKAGELFGKDVPIWRMNQFNVAWTEHRTFTVPDLLKASVEIKVRIRSWKREHARVGVH